MPASIKGLLNDSQIALEKTASDKFGAAVEGFAHGTLGLPDPNKASKDPTGYDGSWYATSYAAALAGTSDFRPKLKFLFKVEFIFTDAAQTIIKAAGMERKEFAFMIKKVDRPKVTFEYEEGVNMYNFRTKVLKNIQHRELTMEFVDDVGNRVFDFFRIMMMIHSPITQRAIQRDGTSKNPDITASSYNQGSGMSFTQLKEAAFNKTKPNTQDNAHRGVVNTTFGNSIQCIRVKQIYVNPTKGQTENIVEMVTYDFINPRITNFDLDDLSHESNEVNTLSMVFDYDWMEMVKVGTLGSKTVPYDESQKQPMSANNTHGASKDLAPRTINGGSNSTAAGGNKGLAGALGSIVDRQVANLSKDLAAKAVKAVAGNGRFANAISQQAAGAFTGAGNSLLNSAMGGVGNLMSTATNAFGRATAKAGSSAAAGADSVMSGTPSMTTVASADDVSYGQT